MSLTIRCPNPDCGQKYSVREDCLGSRTTCKKCGKGFTVEMKTDETGVHNPPASHAPPPSTGGSERAAADRKEPKLLPKAVPLPETPPTKKIGPYTVLRRLGEGGMGEVWLAHDPSLDRDVAIKTLPPRFADNEDRLKRFLREARLAAKLHHTNTVTVYQVGQEGSLVYIAMEYVDGQSLDNAVSEGRPMPWQEATRAIRDAAAGLAAAHELGLVHRDIKPANLMRTKAGVTKVADFGLARSQFAESRMTQEGSVLGTPAYMSPEQWQGGQVDGRSDLYSLACAYYCLLTGQDPFGDAAPGALGYMHCHKPVPDPRQLSPDLPDAVCRILARGLEKKAEERYQSAGELLAELEALLATPAESLLFEFLKDGGPLPRSVPAQTTVGRDGIPTSSRVKTTVRQGIRSVVGGMARGGSRKWLGVAGFGAAALLVLLGIVLLIPTAHGTVKIELSDPKAQVEVKVDGDVIDIAGLKEPLRLKAGEHGLLVRSGDYESVSKSFTVRSGEREVLRVTLERKKDRPAGPQPAVKVAEKPRDVAGPTEAGAPATTARKTSPGNLATKLKEISVELGGGLKLEMVLIPAGEFLMGSPDSDKDALGNEKPQHRVRITKPFYLGKYLVTQEQWKAVMGSNPSIFKGTKNPVEQVSWDDCQQFLAKLNAKSRPGGGRFQLPNEAQWEYACRAGSTARYFFGDDESALGEYAWYSANSDRETHPVGEKKPNSWGLYDMHGNVWEWFQDWYDDGYYASSRTDDPTGPATGSGRVIRGGSWHDPARNCRSAFRYGPGHRGYDMGFRVSLAPANAAAEPTKAGHTDDAALPSADSTIRPPAAGSLVGADGQWKLPPGAPPPAIAPFGEKKAKEHQEAWAKHLGVPVEITNSIGMKLVLIPPGEFMMGSPQELIDEELRLHRDDKEGLDISWYLWHVPREGPQHRVRITKPFWLGATVVTQEEYQRVMGENPSKFSATGKDDKDKDKVAGQDTRRFPVENTSWDQAVEFCRKLSELPGEKALKRQYALQTEAQWEYACRAGNPGRRYFSAQPNPAPGQVEESLLRRYAWSKENSDGQTHPVGQKLPNAWGLYDMYGNVWQWCRDVHKDDYYSVSRTDDPIYDPTVPTTGTRSIFVFRGGCFAADARICCSALRGNFWPGHWFWYMGFRVAVTYDGAMPEPMVKPAEPLPTASGRSTIGAQSALPATTAGKTSPSNLATNSKEISVELGGGIKLEMVLIPAGEFLMGHPGEYAVDSEKPRHRVRITKPFHLGKYLVTQEQWEAVTGDNPSRFKAPKNPVERVSWDDCQQFLQKLNERFRPHPSPFPQGEGEFRLPTEAQWEYACRAGSTTSYYFGNDQSALRDYAWYEWNSDRKTHAVGEKKPNAWGLYDIQGNVWEWCQDWYDDGYYAKSPTDDPTGPETGSDHVDRGNSWGSPAGLCDLATRQHEEPGFRGDRLGLRVALVPIGSRHVEK